MDDPWANAWGEPAKPATDSQTVWPSNSVSSVQDSEADIGMPSWATGAGVQWAEPSEDQATLWHPTSPAKEWATSPYDNISLGKASSDELSQPDNSPTPEIVETTISSPPSSPESLQKVLEPAEDVDPYIRSPTPVSAPTPDPSSPDAFGTFETGLDADEADTDPWSQPVVVPTTEPSDVDTWASSWGTSEPQRHVKVADKQVDDEWEAAKRQKEKQDQHVPPHILASIIREFDGVSSELWPETANTPDQDSRDDRHGGIDGVEGLTAVADRLIPQDLTLPQYVQFSKTFMSKSVAEALRLTRHVPITRTSPLALYLASKGSTAWETSLKSRPESAKDDVLPPGWRVIDKDKEESNLAMDPRKKPSGGLLSFFGRRNPSSPLEINTRRSESPVRQPGVSTPPIPSPATVAPTRISIDSLELVPSTTLGTVPNGSPSSNQLVSPDIITTPIQSPPQDVFEPIQTPSAVSRFLGRFSRTKAGSSPRNSLALSTDDLEFLSDIVPSANDEADEASQLRELSNMIGSSPLPTKLPPPLAPPPRAPPRPPSTLPNNILPAVRPIAPPPTFNDDLMSVFNGLSTSERPGVFPVQSRSSTPISLSFSVHPPASSASRPISPQIPTAQKIEPQATGSSTSSRGAGRSSSPFDFAPSTSRSHISLPPKRSPMAIMSSGSSSSNNSQSIFTLPPPPMLPPPPNSRMSSSEPVSTSQPPSYPTPQKNVSNITDADEFSNFYSPPPLQPSVSLNTSASSAFFDQNLFSTSSNASIPKSNDFFDDFDDFDDFVSSPIRTPSPPRPPSKTSSFGHNHKPSAQRATLPPLPQVSPPPQIKPPAPPRKGSRAADHQRSMSLVMDAAAHTGRWPTPTSPLPTALPLPGASQSSFDGMSDGVSSMQSQPANFVAALVPSVSSPATFPYPVSRQPSLSAAQPATPTSALRAFPPPIPSAQNGTAKLPTLSPSSAPAKSGALSAQDLSFFEGL